VVAGLDSLDDHLAFRTFLVGHNITTADLAVWGAVKGMITSLAGLHFVNCCVSEFASSRDPQKESARALEPMVFLC